MFGCHTRYGLLLYQPETPTCFLRWRLQLGFFNTLLPSPPRPSREPDPPPSATAGAYSAAWTHHHLCTPPGMLMWLCPRQISESSIVHFTHLQISRNEERLNLLAPHPRLIPLEFDSRADLLPQRRLPPHIRWCEIPEIA